MRTASARLLNGNVFAALLIFTVCSPPAHADPINPPTATQTATMTAGEQRNLDMVLNWWREVIDAHHTELAEKYQAEDYIQHNPNIPTGRAAFVKVFSGIPPVNPIPEHLLQPPVVKGARGDFVWLVFEDVAMDPRDSSRTYRFNSFDVLRIQDGKIQEHWDSAKKFSSSPAFVPSTAPPPSTWNTGKLSAKERKNIGLANKTIKPEWKFAPVLTLADGPYVLTMWNVSEKDPADSTKTYIRNHFDVLRIEDGRGKERWDEAKIERTPVKVDEKVLSGYRGNYALTPQVTLVVTLEDGHLMAEAAGQSKFPLIAASETMFFPEDSGAAFEFVRDGDGKVTGLVLHQGGKDLKAQKQ